MIKVKIKSPVRPVVLTLAGNDCSGMAGLAMDIRTQTALGIHTAPVTTANTAQSHTGVDAVNAVDNRVLESQLKATSALPFAVIKSGLIANLQQITQIKAFVEKQPVPWVCDPVLKASSGEQLHDSASANDNTFNKSVLNNHQPNDDYLSRFKTELLPHISVITPNRDEAVALTGQPIKNHQDVEHAAEKLLAMGAQSVVIKGGHRLSQSPQFNNWCQDYFSDGNKSFWLSSKRLDTVNSRGTGCAFASALASALALEYPIYDAVVIAKMAVHQGLRLGYGHDLAQGPISIQAFPDKQIDLPCLTSQGDFALESFKFTDCNSPTMGLYPVVDRASWIPRLAPLGVSTIQLRVKDLADEPLIDEIKSAIKLAKQHNCRLFINDYWQLAIKLGAYGVHLGQEDLDTADIEAIQKAGLALGISTHCHYEVARAHSYQPSYIACGPVYPTDSKIMPWIPHDLQGLSYWRRVLNYPLTAIGGINRSRIADVAKTGVDAIAMISAITQADDPEQVAADFVKLINTNKA